MMIDDQTLNEYRQAGIKVRVVRDILEMNDVKGIVVAWDEENVMIRKQNRRIVKVKRSYLFQPFDEPRRLPPGLLTEE